MIPIYVGYDPREPVAYHTFTQSVIKHASEPVCFVPLSLSIIRDYRERHTDGSNQFIYSRFLVPYLCDFNGHAIFCDGDMIIRDDIAKLWALRSPAKAVQVVKHDYKTKASVKYLGAKNENYPRKNWSSVMIWNCAHHGNRNLTPELIESKTGAFLHRFEWLADSQIGELPIEWNWLAEEYPHKEDAKLVHYTLGTPCFKEYANCDYSNEWHATKEEANFSAEFGGLRIAK